MTPRRYLFGEARMHDVQLPPTVVVRVRRGRLHIHDAFAGAQTALVVIDMQAAFLGEGKPSEVPAAALQK